MPDYMRGSCVSLAIALHDITRWRLVKIVDEQNARRHTGGPRAPGGPALHWAVEHPSGHLLDWEGLRGKDEVVSTYAPRAQPGTSVRWRYATREDAVDERRQTGACTVEEAKEDAHALADEFLPAGTAP